MSKGERNRIKIRVKAATGAQAKDESRFLGGRPPYGYLIADARPHSTVQSHVWRCPSSVRSHSWTGTSKLATALSVDNAPCIAYGLV